MDYRTETASIDKSAHLLDVPRALSDLIELDETVGWMLEWAKANGDDTLVLATADHGHGFDVYGTVDTKVWDDAVVASEDNPVSDVENYCAEVTDNAGNVFTSNKETVLTNMTLREENRARRRAVGTYNDAGYTDYTTSNGSNFPDTWEVRTTLAAGMNNGPDHTEDFKVTKSIKVPALNISDGTYLNNPEDAPNGIFMSGNLAPKGSTGVHTMQDVGLFASGPGSDMVSGIIDNTEIFHVIASALGFGTDGKKDEDAYTSSGDLITCRHSGNTCHCDIYNDEYMCSCPSEGPTVYVPRHTKMCKSDTNGFSPVA